MRRKRPAEVEFVVSLWKSRDKIDFLGNLHCFFMCGLMNFLEAILPVQDCGATTQADPDRGVYFQPGRHRAAHPGSWSSFRLISGEPCNLGFVRF